jgi:hypothetical protein
MASEVRSGSISTKLGYPGDVRFSPDSDRTADTAGGPKGADFVAEVGCDGLGRWAFWLRAAL